MDTEREQGIDDAVSWVRSSPLMQLVETVPAGTVIALARARQREHARLDVPRRLARGTGANLALERPAEPASDRSAEPVSDRSADPVSDRAPADESIDPPQTSTL